MTHRPARRRTAALAALLVSCALTTPAWAQSAPPVRLIVPFNPGGGSDLFGRLIAPGISKALEQTVVVENRAGAGGAIGADLVAKSEPDGRVILISDSAAYSVSPSLYPALPYKASDLVPVAEAARFANVLLVAAGSPYNTLGDILAAARKSPGKLSIASAGNGSSPHLTAEKFQRAAGIQLIHVPYKGSGPAIADTMGGQVDMVFSGLPSVSAQLAGGKLKAIAIAANTRSPYAPDVPTMSESGVPGFESLISQGFFVPRGTPDAVIRKINAAVNGFMNAPEQTERLRTLKVEPKAHDPVAYKAWLDSEATAWSTLIREAGIRVE